MPTRQQKFECIMRNLNAANNSGSREEFDYWINRLAMYIWANRERVTIASGK